MRDIDTKYLKQILKQIAQWDQELHLRNQAQAQSDDSQDEQTP